MELRVRRISVVVGAAIVAVVLILMALLNTFIGMVVPIVISLLALLVSVFTAFRSELFPFEIIVLAGPPVLYDTMEKGPEHCAVILQLSFLNVGYAEGIIESLALRVVDEKGNGKLYDPVVELDHTSFMKSMSNPLSEGYLNTFTAFALHSKASESRVWAFVPQEDNLHYPLVPWHTGQYQFEVFAKALQWDKPRLVTKFERPFDADTLTGIERKLKVVLAKKTKEV